jgi:hypothetical protein
MWPGGDGPVRCQGCIRGAPLAHRFLPALLVGRPSR